VKLESADGGSEEFREGLILGLLYSFLVGVTLGKFEGFSLLGEALFVTTSDGAVDG